MSYEFDLGRLTFAGDSLCSSNQMSYATYNTTMVMAMCMCTGVGLWVERGAAIVKV
jgi:hypothetical protein